MNTQTVEYKARAFELCHLAYFFLIVFGLQVIRYGLSLSGLLKEPTLRLLLITLASWAPTITAFVLMAITEGRAGIEALWRRFWNRDIRIQWLLVILLLIPAIWLTANLASRILDGQAYPLFDQPALFIPAFGIGIINGLNEEFGWRGYVLPRFQAKWNALRSSLILGVIWASWHFGKWFVPENTQENIWLFTLWITVNSIFLTWIFNNTKGSVLGAVLFHAMMNSAHVIFWCCGELWHYYAVYALAGILVVIFFGAKSLVRQRTEDTKLRQEGPPLAQAS